MNDAHTISIITTMIKNANAIVVCGVLEELAANAPQLDLILAQPVAWFFTPLRDRQAQDLRTTPVAAAAAGVVDAQQAAFMGQMAAAAAGMPPPVLPPQLPLAAAAPPPAPIKKRKIDKFFDVSTRQGTSDKTLGKVCKELRDFLGSPHFRDNADGEALKVMALPALLTVMVQHLKQEDIPDDVIMDSFMAGRYGGREEHKRMGTASPSALKNATLTLTKFGSLVFKSDADFLKAMRSFLRQHVKTEQQIEAAVPLSVRPGLFCWRHPFSCFCLMRARASWTGADQCAQRRHRQDQRALETSRGGVGPEAWLGCV